MIGELNAGHTYVFGGDDDDAESVATGLLGVDFVSPPSGDFHRIARIIPGNNADPAERSPLQEPGCPIEPGNFILAIDGMSIAATDNPLAALVDKADRVVTLTYNDRPTADGAKTCRVRTLRSEDNIRYREWVEQKRAYVEAAANGEIGYVHVPDMMEEGLIEFSRVFFPQYQKRAFIIDDRYNTGGFVGDMIVDRLERRSWAFTKPREGKPVRNPERGFHGHLAVIVNEHTGSNGEYFAEAIKSAGLAPIIGMRTWGGAVGIEPHQILVDGGTTTPPQFAPYGFNGKWLIEGHGVDPDIVVENMPADVLRGQDAQLEKAVEVLRNMLRDDPKTIPSPPPYPDKTKRVQTPAGS
jgi:tricorn protease